MVDIPLKGAKLHSSYEKMAENNVDHFMEDGIAINKVIWRLIIIIILSE